jgi:putative ABC transport system permease protein
MLAHYISMAWRSILKGKYFSLINIFGLAVGISAFLIIMLYVGNELSYDKFHKFGNRIYRVGLEIKSKEGTVRTAQITAAILPDLMSICPEIENGVRLRVPQTGYFSFKNRSVYLDNVLYADSTFLDIFSFTLLKGNPHKALSGPYSIVLTETEAFSLFRNEDPIGKIILYEGNSWQVTGVAKDPPANSHIRFRAVLSFTTLYKDSRLYLGWNGGMQYYGYILLKENSSLKDLQAKFPKLLYEKINHEMESSGIAMNLIVDPFSRIYLYSGLPDEIGPTGNLAGIKIFALVALFILIIACFNFININLSRVSDRNKEVGMRKANGADRRALINQFLIEVFIQVLIASFVAFIVTEFILSYINTLLGKDLNLLRQMNRTDIIITVGMLFLITLVSGISPAFLMASIDASGVMQNKFNRGRPNVSWRNGMVAIQFMITGFLLVGATVVFMQQRFIRSKNLGFDRDNILAINLTGDKVKSQADAIRTELESLSGVESAALASDFPGRGFTSNGYTPEGRKDPIMINVVDVDNHYLASLGLRIIKGRNFLPDITSDKKAYLVNETLVRQMGWDDAIGKKITRGGDHFVIGVVNDFHFASLHEQIGPLIFTQEPYMGFDYILLKIGKKKVPDVIRSAESLWLKFFPGTVFRYSFLEQEFELTYRAEQHFGQLMLLFSLLAMIIAAMGLYGLALLSATKRTREIGVRKVMGAGIWNILVMLVGEFTLLVAIANLIMWPVAWILSSKWLQGFAYHVKLSIWPFAFVLCLMLIIATMAVGWRSYKVACRNPSVSLRYE